MGGGGASRGPLGHPHPPLSSLGFKNASVLMCALNPWPQLRARFICTNELSCSFSPAPPVTAYVLPGDRFNFLRCFGCWIISGRTLCVKPIYVSLCFVSLYTRLYTALVQVINRMQLYALLCYMTCCREFWVLFAQFCHTVPSCILCPQLQGVIVYLSVTQR